MTISEIIQKYKNQLDYLDLEILIANSLGKTREFVLTYPNQTITKIQETKTKKNISRRIHGEPLAYILGHKEFYGLDFKVNKHTLVPRPETELLVELVLNESKVESQKSKVIVMDIGTGSGNIIISIANLDSRLRGNDKVEYFGIDISKDAIKVAKKNAKLNGVDKKIKFLNGSLLEPFIGNWKLEIGNSTIIIVANLPYLSKEIYDSAPVDVKKFEPKSALYSPEEGLKHYRKLLEQIKKFYVPCSMFHITCFFEISPEQKQLLAKIIKNIFPTAKIEFEKDLAGKWRVCKINI